MVKRKRFDEGFLSIELVYKDGKEVIKRFYRQGELETEYLLNDDGVEIQREYAEGRVLKEAPIKQQITEEKKDEKPREETKKGLWQTILDWFN